MDCEAIEVAIGLPANPIDVVSEAAVRRSHACVAPSSGVPSIRNLGDAPDPFFD